MCYVANLNETHNWFNFCVLYLRNVLDPIKNVYISRRIRKKSKLDGPSPVSVSELL